MFTRHHSLLRWIVCGALVVVLSYAILSAASLIYAERLMAARTLPAMERALRWDPGNARYWLLYADALDLAALPSKPALTRAAELNPLDATAWIRLGLDAEGRGDYPAAERYLLESARVSRLYQPRWTLANFYFRRGSRDSFWTWARRAIELAPREPQALFGLCWSISGDPVEIMNKLLPDVPSAWRYYVQFLLAEKRLAAASLAIGRIKEAGAEDRDALLQACDRFLENRMVEPALAAWNLLCRGGALSCRELHPDSQASLTNGGFQAPGFGSGFNWHLNHAPGFTASMGGGRVAVYFSGKQAEQAIALWQWIPVAPAKRYVLRFEYQTEGIEDRSCLRWQAAAADGSVNVLASSPYLWNSTWKQETLHFDAPADVRLVRLELTYSRTPGSVRTDGAILMRAMTLEPAS